MGRSTVQRCFYRGCLLALLLSTGLLSQGCMAAAWVAAVAFDSTRNSSVSFEPFESTWVKGTQSEDTAGQIMLSSVALLPMESEDDMGRRLVEILRQQTALRVESVAGSAAQPAALLSDETGRAAIAEEVSRARSVDAVLFARVTIFPAHSSDSGWKGRESRRLFLYLVDRNGRPLWKDELPYKMVIGSKPLLDGSTQASLSQHLMTHVRELGLDTLGYLPAKKS